MRLITDNPGVPECSGGESAATAGDDGGGGGAAVVVGVKLDSRSKELLTWALVKVAQSGDRVIALHILDPNADKSSLLALVKTFDSVLAAYEGFCNLKQVDLKLKVCRGSPVRKILFREAKSCGATNLILGTSKVHHKIRSRISIAKYCAKNLPRNISVICVDNGKIVFEREPNASNSSEFGNIDLSESRLKRRKILPKSPLSQNDLSASMALVPVKSQEIRESKSGWAILRSVLLHGRRVCETSPAKKSSVMQWILKLPSRQSVSAIYPDHKPIISSDRDECHLDSVEKEDAIVVYSADTISSKIFLEELKALAEKYSTKCELFSYQELVLATNNFIIENLIGTGGSSKVYKGCLPGGKELAVKILKPSRDVLRQFISEIEIITSLHHKNIISLVGFCIEDDNLLLVYNLLSRGSLEENLHGIQKSENLFSWEERYKVALGVAMALDYLHNTDGSIVHRDVKSSNILLSDNFEPQLSDFGLATWASDFSHHLNASDVAGTFGYLAPEYFMHGKLNDKIDVYAFGVVLLELLSGKKPIDNEQSKGHESLVMWAKHILKEGKVSQLQDPKLVNASDEEQFEIMVLAATLCIRDTPQSRPKINIVLKLLQGDSEAIKWAKQETNTSEESNVTCDEQSVKNIQSFINLALLDLDDDSGSTSSNEHNSISVEDYLGGRWSRSSSFD